MVPKVVSDEEKKSILIAGGLGPEIDQVKQGRCPTCREVVIKKDFKDRLSRREFKISGLCQVCQDKVFKKKKRK